MMDVALWDELPTKADGKKKRRRRRHRSHLQDMLDLELPDSLSSYQAPTENQTPVIIEDPITGTVKTFSHVHSGAIEIGMYKSDNSTEFHTPGQQRTTWKASSTSPEFPSCVLERSGVVRTTQASHTWATRNRKYDGVLNTLSHQATAPLSQSKQLGSIRKEVQHKYIPTLNPMGLDPYAQFMSYVFSPTETTVYHPAPATFVPNCASTSFDGPFPAAVLLPQSLPSYGYGATRATNGTTWDRGNAW